MNERFNASLCFAGHFLEKTIIDKHNNKGLLAELKSRSLYDYFKRGRINIDVLGLA